MINQSDSLEFMNNVAEVVVMEIVYTVQFTLWDEAAMTDTMQEMGGEIMESLNYTDLETEIDRTKAWIK